MTRSKKKGFVRAQRFFKRYGLFFNAFFTLLNVILFILPLIVGQEFVIIKTIHQINLDVTDAYAHPRASLTISASVTVTIQNASGTYTNGVRSSGSANALIQNASGTNTSNVRSSDSVTMTVQNASGTYTSSGS
jgi:hypothetical protein